MNVVSQIHGARRSTRKVVYEWRYKKNYRYPQVTLIKRSSNVGPSAKNEEVERSILYLEWTGKRVNYFDIKRSSFI
jgi:hypothetical protein